MDVLGVIILRQHFFHFNDQKDERDNNILDYVMIFNFRLRDVDIHRINKIKCYLFYLDLPDNYFRR